MSYAYNAAPEMYCTHAILCPAQYARASRGDWATCKNYRVAAVALLFTLSSAALRPTATRPTRTPSFSALRPAKGHTRCPVPSEHLSDCSVRRPAGQPSSRLGQTLVRLPGQTLVKPQSNSSSSMSISASTMAIIIIASISAISARWSAEGPAAAPEGPAPALHAAQTRSTSPSMHCRRVGEEGESGKRGGEGKHEGRLKTGLRAGELGGCQLATWLGRHAGAAAKGELVLPVVRFAGRRGPPGSWWCVHQSHT